MIELNELKLYSVKEVMKILKVTRVTVYNYINNGSLDSNRIGGVYCITEKQLEAFLSTPHKKK